MSIAFTFDDHLSLNTPALSFIVEPHEFTLHLFRPKLRLLTNIDAIEASLVQQLMNNLG